jgi:histidinol dehydrogenase
VAERLRLEGDPRELAARLRAAVAADLEAPVREILARVRREGDAALRDYARRLDGVEGDPRVSGEELATARLPDAVRAGLETAIANVGAVARAALGRDRELSLPQGQSVRLREVPVGRAAVYVPGGRAPYPSTVVMGAIAAREAGVGEIVVCSPGGHEAVLGACALCGVDEVYRVGGAHAVAALAYGTESVAPVDVIVGPGNAWVTEAKRQVYGEVGIDGLAGPSELAVLCDDPAAVGLVALDLRAQAEHGPDSLVVAISPHAEVLAALAGEATAVEVADLDAGLAFAEALAPEDLQLVGAGAEALAPRVRRAGCVFVGAASGTAFGDYVAGSNHVLPTGGAARFASGLSPASFRRRMAEVHVGPAAAELARAGAPVARAEGFELHAESMEARIEENRSP